MGNTKAMALCTCIADGGRREGGRSTSVLCTTFFKSSEQWPVVSLFAPGSKGGRLLIDAGGEDRIGILFCVEKNEDLYSN